MPLSVKICGLTRVEDASWALDCGADFLGVVLCDGPRRLELDRAARLIAGLPGRGERVPVLGVVRDPDHETVRRALAAGFDGLQLQGRESPGAVAELRRAFPRALWWKALAVRARSDLASISDYAVDAVLLDAGAPGESGGGGVPVPAAAEDIRKAAAGTRVVLAGGLTPENVAEAVRRARPWAVDVSSGVEEAPGVKSRERVRAFIDRARAAARAGEVTPSAPESAA